MTVVAPAAREHVEALATMAEEMERFYAAPEPESLDVWRRQIDKALFADPPSAYALLAWDAGRPAGFAFYSFLWPSVGLSRVLFLKELYVVEAARRTGAGTAIMRSLAQTAIKHECIRLEWQTNRHNTDAQRFYAGLGLSVNEAKLTYRTEGDALRELANGH